MLRSKWTKNRVDVVKYGMALFEIVRSKANGSVVRLWTDDTPPRGVVVDSGRVIIEGQAVLSGRVNMLVQQGRIVFGRREEHVFPMGEIRLDLRRQSEGAVVTVDGYARLGDNVVRLERSSARGDAALLLEGRDVKIVTRGPMESGEYKGHITDTGELVVRVVR
jgi:hypothetical protein